MAISIEQAVSFPVPLDKNGIGNGWCIFSEFGNRRVFTELEGFAHGHYLGRGHWCYKIYPDKGFLILPKREDAKKCWIEMDYFDNQIEQIRFKEVMRTGYYKDLALIEVGKIYIYWRKMGILRPFLMRFQYWNPNK
jgi:hypothetical protein